MYRHASASLLVLKKSLADATSDTVVERELLSRERALHRIDGGYRDKSLEVEACVPVLPESLTTLGGRIVDGTARAASLEFSGSYERAPASYVAIEKWIGSRGARAVGPLRETYLRFGADPRGYQLPRQFLANSATDYRTALQVPIAGS